MLYNAALAVFDVFFTIKPPVTFRDFTCLRQLYLLKEMFFILYMDD